MTTTEHRIFLNRKGFHLANQILPITGTNARVRKYQGETHVLLDLDRAAADAMFNAAACPANAARPGACLCGGVHAPIRVSPLSSEMGDMSGTYAIPFADLEVSARRLFGTPSNLSE